MAKAKRKAKPKIGAPTKFDERYIHEVEGLTKLGLTDAQIADAWGITSPTLYTWQKKYPAFKAAMVAGKLVADGAVAKSLYRRATGTVEIKATKMFQYEGAILTQEYIERYPPDATSMIFWLKNRRPDLWREKTEVLNKVEPGTDGKQPASLVQIAREIAFALHTAALEVDEAGKAPKSAPADTPLKH